MTRVLVLGATGDQGHPLLTRLMDAGSRPSPRCEILTLYRAQSLPMSKQCKQIFMTRNL